MRYIFLLRGAAVKLEHSLPFYLNDAKHELGARKDKHAPQILENTNTACMVANCVTEAVYYSYKGHIVIVRGKRHYGWQAYPFYDRLLAIGNHLTPHKAIQEYFVSYRQSLDEHMMVKFFAYLLFYL